MKALVTGSAGFIGRHMVQELGERGYDVYGLDPAGDPIEQRFGQHKRYPQMNDMGHSYYYKNDALEFFNSGIRTKFDLTVHCAYHVGGRAAIDGVNQNFAKNLQLDAAMFEWAVRTKQKRVLYFSSSAAYPVSLQGREDPYKWTDFERKFPNSYKLEEDDIHLGLTQDYDPMPDANYGWAKLTGERLAEDARKNGLAVTVVRPFSGYGEDQSFDYPFPSIVQRATQGDLTVWGPSGQSRDWIHVSDVVAGALAVVDSDTTDPVNLCTGRGVEMGELACMIANAAHLKRTGGEYDGGYVSISHIQYDESKPTGVFYRVGDPTRLHQYYVPKVTLEEGIQKALAVLR